MLILFYVFASFLLSVTSWKTQGPSSGLVIETKLRFDGGFIESVDVIRLYSEGASADSVRPASKGEGGILCGINYCAADV